MTLEITRVEIREFEYDLADVGKPDRSYFGSVYSPGESTTVTNFAVRIHTDAGVVGSYVSELPRLAVEQIDLFADYLVGEDALARERHWSEIKRGLRKYDRMGLGPVDIALWDLAGRYHDAPIHELLGSFRESLPAYASTFHGDENGGLDSPEAYADFAEECLEMGYPAFKLHVWDVPAGERDMDREVETVRAVGNAVGDGMDLMLDPACDYGTWADALEVGRELDEQGFYWYEDPYRDAGDSQHGHRKLREFLDTPILQTEMTRGLEAHADFVAADATDFVRADPEYDGGITGTTKLARIAEGFGLDVEIHKPGPARRQCFAAIRNTNYYELGLVHPDADDRRFDHYAGDYSDALDAIDDDGRVWVPDGPGLGVEYDWTFIEDNETDRVVYE